MNIPFNPLRFLRMGKRFSLNIPSLTPTMQFHVNFTGNFADGIPLDGYLHGTIHALEDRDSVEDQ